MIVEERLGSSSPNITRSGPAPWAIGGLDELLLAQGEHLTAHRPRHVGDVDDADDQDRDPDRAAGELQRADLQAADRQREPERDRQQEHREGPDHVQRPRDRPCRSSRGSNRRAGRGSSPAGSSSSAAARPMRSEVAPAVHQPDHLVAAEAAVGAEEEACRPAPSQTRPDRLAFGVDDFALFAVDLDLLQGVGVVRPGVGDVVGPERRRQRRRGRSGRRGRRRRARPGCGAGAAGEAPRAAAARGRPPRRWARRPPASVKQRPGGYFELEARQVVPEGRVEDHACRGRSRCRRRSRRCWSRRGPTAPVPCIPCRVPRIRLPARARAVLRRAWRSSRSAPGRRCGRSSCCRSARCFPRSAAAGRRRSGSGSPANQAIQPVSRSGVDSLPIIV